MDEKQKKEWIKKRFMVLPGKTITQALLRYWVPKRDIRPQEPLDLYTEAVKIFK